MFNKLNGNVKAMNLKILELAAKRKNYHISQRALGQEIGLSQLTVIDIERGRLPVTPETVDAIDAAIERLSSEKQMVNAAQ